MNCAHLLFSQGFGTRRECAALVARGSVRIDGRAVDPDEELDAVEGRVFEVDGQPWPYHDKALLLLHKPVGCECSQRPRHHPSVLSLLPMVLRRRGVQPIGRLDADTSGALLLSDDGALIHRLTSPKRHVPKVYEVGCKHPLDDAQVQRLLGGVVLDDDPAPVRAKAAALVSPTHLRLTLTEGKYHQVKRMLAAVGNRVQSLHRSAFGSLTLEGLEPPGSWRWVGSEERARVFTGGAPRSAA